MTVQELIDQLSNYDMDAEVVLVTNGGNLLEPVSSIQETDPEDADELELNPNTVEIWS